VIQVPMGPLIVVDDVDDENDEVTL
jgi:hypothetical protein